MYRCLSGGLIIGVGHNLTLVCDETTPYRTCYLCRYTREMNSYSSVT